MSKLIHLKHQGSRSSKRTEGGSDKKLKYKLNQGMGNSFYEEDENNLYEYYKYKNNAENSENYFYKSNTSNPNGNIMTNNEKIHNESIKNIENHLNINFNFDTKKNFINENSKFDKIISIHQIKKNIQNDKFLIPINSPRVPKIDPESSESYNESSLEKSSIEDKMILTDNLSKGKNKLKVFDAKELNDFHELNEDQINLKKVEKCNLVNLDNNNLIKFKNKNALVNNNVILIKPQILSSKKQIIYERLIENNEKKYMYQIIKQEEENEKIKREDFEFKIEMFRKFVNDLKEMKYVEKLKYLRETERLKEGLEIIEKKSDLRFYTKEDRNNSRILKERKSRIKRNNKNSCCTQVLNFFIGDPLKSFAKRKHIWCGEHGAFDSDYQDHRVYELEDLRMTN